MEAFVSVVRLNSFSKAAESVFLSQPTVSAHVSSLEKELGAQLLVRSTKEVYPTKIGMELYRQASNILALRDQAITTVRGSNGETSGEINIVASSVPAQYLLPKVIADFHMQYPNILIRVNQLDSDQVGEMLKGCSYDFGITGTQLLSSKLQQQPFYKDTMVIACPAGLQEATQPAELCKLLTTQPFVLREDGSGTLHELERYLRGLDLTLHDLKPAGYFSNTQSVVHAVANGLGISFVSKAAVSLYVQLGRIKTIEIDRNRFYREFYILQKKEVVLSPIMRLFQDFLIASCKENAT